MTSSAKKKKLCWNCEGNVSFQEENCPYCGVYLSPSDDDPVDEGGDLFAPPYQVESKEQEEIPASPYATVAYEENEEVFDTKEIKEAMRSTSDEVKRVIMPLSFLLSGTVFFLFGLALFLFSNQGVFILQWNGGFWYLYLSFGLLALIMGWKALNQLEEVE